jgi:hypothetical protein
MEKQLVVILTGRKNSAGAGKNQDEAKNLVIVSIAIDLPQDAQINTIPEIEINRQVNLRNVRWNSRSNPK